jgi:voltage-gated potassium channel
VKERGSALYQLTILMLSVYVLSALVAEDFFVTDPEIAHVLQYIDLSVCLIYLMDFGYNLYRADRKLEYMK